MQLWSASKYWRAAGAAFTDTVALDRLGIRQKILFAVSAANLSLIWQWRETIYARPADLFYLPLPDGRSLAALLTVLAIISAVIYALVNAVYRLPDRWRSNAMIVLIVVLAFNLLNAIRLLLGISFTNEPWFGLIVVALAAVLIVRPRWLPTLFVWVALILSPLVVLNAGRACWTIYQLAKVEKSPAPAPSAPIAAARPAHPPRVIWLIFDELDNRILKQHLHQLPNFKSLIETSVVATRAVPPGGDTIRAVPALLLGRPILDSKPVGPDRLVLRPEGRAGTPVPFRVEETVLGRMHNAGARVAISGLVFLPYCRMFSRVADWCQDRMLFPARDHVARTYWSDLGAWLLSLLPINGRRNQHLNYNRVISHAGEISRDTYDVVYMHLPVPHLPWFWRPDRTDPVTVGMGIAYDIVISDADGYLNNLRLADEQLGRILKDFRSSSAWRETILIVCGDHGLRKPIPGWPGVFDGQRERWGNAGDVPIIVQVPGQDSKLEILEEVDSLNIVKLVEAAWKGSIRTPHDVRLVLSLDAGRARTSKGGGE